MRGRPRKPRIFTGDGPDDRPKPSAGVPRCPVDLDKIAKKKWRDLVKVIGHTGLITLADQDTLAMYCTAYSRWRHAEKVLTEMPAVLKCESGAVIQNPALAIANRAMEQMRIFGNMLGLDPSSRERLKVTVQDKKKGAHIRDHAMDPPPPKGARA